MAPEYEPSLQGSAADAPSAQYEPGTQTWQWVRPDAFINLPAPHLLHVSCAFSGCTVPALHGVGSVLPVGAWKPGTVGVQSAAELRSVLLE